MLLYNEAQERSEIKWPISLYAGKYYAQQERKGEWVGLVLLEIAHSLLKQWEFCQPYHRRIVS